MKKILYVLVFGLLAFQSQAQVKFGLKAGLSSSDFYSNDILVNGNSSFESIKLAVTDANYGFQFGGFFQIKTGLVFLQPEILLNSSSYDFRVTDFSEGPGFTKVIRETYNTIDIPVLMGFKLGPLRAGIGPVGKVHLNHTGGLADVRGITQDFKDITFGYQAGIGLNLWHLTLDLRVENSINKFGDHLSVFDQQIEFDQGDKKISFSVGYIF